MAGSCKLGSFQVSKSNDIAAYSLTVRRVNRKGHSSEEELDDSDEQVEDRDRVDTLRTPLCEFTGPGGHLSVKKTLLAKLYFLNIR